MGLLSVLGLLEPGASGQATPGGTSAGKESPEAALAKWRSARAEAITLLKRLAAQAAAEKDAESAKAVMETQAVIKNLSADPASAQQVHELRQWLANDDVVSDVCAMDTDIRQPLLAALDSVGKAL